MVRRVVSDLGRLDEVLSVDLARQSVVRPDEIGAAVAFPPSKEASYCTGSTFYVDGGWLAG